MLHLPVVVHDVDVAVDVDINTDDNGGDDDDGDDDDGCWLLVLGFRLLVAGCC